MITFVYFVYYIFFCIFAYIFMRVIKKKYIAQMIILIMAISIFNNGIIWINETNKKVEKKIEKWDKRITNIEDKFNSVVEKIDQTNDTINKTEDKINNNKVTKGLNNGIDKVNQIDKKIKDFGFGIREKITGQKVKRLE